MAQATIGNINPSNALDLEAAQLATCAQVEYWLNVDEGISITGGYESMSIGSTSINFGGSQQDNKDMSPRARRYLSDRGLLYRGVKMRLGEVD